MPCSLSFRNFREDTGDRDSPKGRTLYLYARPSNAYPQEWPVAWKDLHMGVQVLQVDRCRPILGKDVSEDALLLEREHLERKLMKGTVQDAQIQDWS